jgi:hypothetical protein
VSFADCTVANINADLQVIGIQDYLTCAFMRKNHIKSLEARAVSLPFCSASVGQWFVLDKISINEYAGFEYENLVSEDGGERNVSEPKGLFDADF